MKAAKKKVKKAGNEEIRKTWEISPVTRIKKSDKGYKRHKKHRDKEGLE